MESSTPTPSNTNLPNNTHDNNNNNNNHDTFFPSHTLFVPAHNGASLVLTHFCETHGPSVVFTTQIISPSTNTTKHSHSSKSSQHQMNGNDAQTSKVNVKFISEDDGENNNSIPSDEANHSTPNNTIYVKSKSYTSSSQTPEQPQTPRKNSRAIFAPSPQNNTTNNINSTSTTTSNTTTSNNSSNASSDSNTNNTDTTPSINITNNETTNNNNTTTETNTIVIIDGTLVNSKRGSVNVDSTTTIGSCVLRKSCSCDCDCS
eukprot:TRINITY_DN4841_c0_g1_i1.p1 TRINITY_DN4841_c0_g1~~TRINITY_DN4841_c0_g1_i1.p1  ORF type:complete len:260 (-),score=88.12 TRINITY_DN4841_c0_g1_i1:15-794(-)